MLTLCLIFLLGLDTSQSARRDSKFCKLLKKEISFDLQYNNTTFLFDSLVFPSGEVRRLIMQNCTIQETH